MWIEEPLMQISCFLDFPNPDLVQTAFQVWLSWMDLMQLHFPVFFDNRKGVKAYI